MFCKHQLLVPVTGKAAWFNINIRQGGIGRKNAEMSKEGEKKRDEMNII